MGRYTAGGVGRDMLVGALAGVAAIWVTDKLDWSLYRSGGPQRIRQTEAARPGRSVIAAEPHAVHRISPASPWGAAHSLPNSGRPGVLARALT